MGRLGMVLGRGWLGGWDWAEWLVRPLPLYNKPVVGTTGELSNCFQNFQSPPPKQGIPWFLNKMVAHFTMRTGVKKEFRFVEGILLHRKSSQIRFFFGKDLFFMIRAHSEMSNHLI